MDRGRHIYVGAVGVPAAGPNTTLSRYRLLDVHGEWRVEWLPQ